MRESESTRLQAASDFKFTSFILGKNSNMETTLNQN